MICYLLDTNACIRLLNADSQQLVKHLREHEPHEIGISAVVRGELLYGARHSRRAQANIALLKRFLAPFPSVPFDDRCAEHYGIIRAQLAASGTPIGPNDTLIAATARAHSLTLVTNNVREFRRVEELLVEDWQTS